jgi:hypothetical protein
MTLRVYSALTCALLLTACSGNALPGASAVPAGSVQAQGTISFQNLVVNQVLSYRDGGTVIAKGYVTRSTYVSIKLDGAMASATKGQVFVETHEFQQPEGAWRQATPDELPAIAAALRLNVTRAGANLDLASLGRLTDAVAALASAPVPAPATPAAPGVATGIAILRPDATRTTFQLTATLDAKSLVVGYQGMPGAYMILSASLAGVALDPAGRKAAAAALKAGAAAAGRQAMIVEEVAEALER